MPNPSSAARKEAANGGRGEGHVQMKSDAESQLFAAKKPPRRRWNSEDLCCLWVISSLLLLTDIRTGNKYVFKLSFSEFRVRDLNAQGFSSMQFFSIIKLGK